MRFRVRKAKIAEDLRATYEQYGVIGMQSLLATLKPFRLPEGTSVDAWSSVTSLLPWLAEQYDRSERKETWSMIMEIAIVILVAAELVFSVIGFVHSR